MPDPPFSRDLPQDDPVPTLKDVAERAGLSVTTASHALRGFARVPESTRARVRRAAEELGYVPNALMSAMGSRRRRGKDRTTAGFPLLYVHQTEGREKASFGPDHYVFQAAVIRAKAMGYRLDWGRLQDFGEPRTLGRTLYSRGYGGVILGAYEDLDYVRAIDWSRFAVICCLIYQEHLPFHTVRFSRYRITQALVQRCVERGYRRIGLQISAGTDVRMSQEILARIAGYQAVIQTTPGLEPLQVLNHPLNYDNPAPLEQWLESEQPDVILSDYNAYVVAHHLKNLGIRVPEDVGLASQSAQVGENFSGYLPRRDQLGIAAVEWMGSLLHMGQLGPQEHPRDLIIDCDWQEGQTLPPR